MFKINGCCDGGMEVCCSCEVIVVVEMMDFDDNCWCCLSEIDNGVVDGGFTCLRDTIDLNT